MTKMESSRLTVVSRLHFYFGAAMLAQLIIYDAWKLVSPDALLMRWIVLALFLLAVTTVWYKSRSNGVNLGNYSLLLIVADVAVASYGVYSQRGMASRAVMLFVVPIIVASLLQSRRALYATATLCTIAYTTAAVSYFVTNFNEGFKIELYGEVGFYSVVFFIIAKLLSVISVNKPS